VMGDAEPVKRAGVAPHTGPSVTSINMGPVARCNADRNGNHDVRWCGGR
jgi:hypothetical protein